jgi:hypothetical protein
MATMAAAKYDTKILKEQLTCRATGVDVFSIEHKRLSMCQSFTLLKKGLLLPSIERYFSLLIRNCGWLRLLEVLSTTRGLSKYGRVFH